MSVITNHSKHFDATGSKEIDFSRMANEIKAWATELGFQQTGITHTRLDEAQAHLLNWLKAGYHGQMAYMEKHGNKRCRPDELLPGTISIISVRMDYLPDTDIDPLQLLETQHKAYVARYALGRDYHKVLRNRLQKLATKIEHIIGPFSYRVFTDSAPVMEKAISEKAGIGWIGKHSNLIHKQYGSWFFLGEIYTDLPLPLDTPAENHCGSCTSCIDICPTNAIIAPYQVDARLCISYLTIEYRDSIPEELRPLLGNRIYGCDDCQLICPWNRFANTTKEEDFQPRQNLDAANLIDLFVWTEAEFLTRMEGSPIRRIGHVCWLRNIAVALGNAPASQCIVKTLNKRLNHPSEMLKEHILWAIDQQKIKQQTAN